MKSKESSVSVGNPFSSLRHRSYRYYWIGMAVSTIGTWMQNVAQPWLAYKLTDSAFLLGLVGALQFIPVLMFSLFAGVLIDRFEKKNIIFLTQTASLLITLALAILDATGHIAYWHLIITSTLIGFVNTFDMPTRQSFVIELVGKEDLTNGIALNSASFNIARIVGPALAGVIMGQWGTATCFFINAVSYGAVILSLFFIKPYKIEKTTMLKTGIFSNIHDGLKFIFSKRTLLMPLLFLVVGATFAMNFNVLVPVFSIQVLGQGETGFGLLMSMGGVGALAGALTMAAVSKGGPKKVFLYVFPFIAGVLVLAIGLTSVFILAALTLMLVSFFYMIFMASVNTTMQMNSTNEFRGRIMSVFTLVVAGSTPLGNLFAGAFTEGFNARVGFIACGAAIVILLTPLMIYQRVRNVEPTGQTDRP
jgi:MFS family permease